MKKILAVFIVLFSFTAFADADSGSVVKKRGFLIVDISTSRSDVLNLILKLDEIESVIRSKENTTDGVEYHIVINMDKRDEHFESASSYNLRFTNLARSSLVYKDIMEALTS